MRIELLLTLVGMLALAAGSGLVGPGAMTPYSGGGGGRQRRFPLPEPLPRLNRATLRVPL